MTHSSGHIPENRSSVAEKYWAVDVAVPFPLDTPYTYLIPKWLPYKEVKPGYRVLVPFRSKVVHGITMSNAFEPKAQIKKIRPLIHFEGRHQILSDDLRKIMDWMVQHYKAPLGEVLKLILAPSRLEQKQSGYRLTDAGRDLLINEPDSKTVSWLKNLQGMMSKSAWESKMGKKIRYQSDFRGRPTQVSPMNPLSN